MRSGSSKRLVSRSSGSLVLVGEHHLYLLTGPGDGCLDGGGGGGDQWGSPVADPVRAGVTAGRERGRVGPAAVEAEQDRGAGAEHLS